MEEKAKCKHPLYWFGCYRGTYDLLSPPSVAHPAKMSVALCYRIFQHLEELGLIKQGDKVLDPMAGTGITNICAGAMGYSSISVELEEKFVGFEKENKEYAERRLYKPLDWTMIKGDSRRLSELLKGQELKSVTSPPYVSNMSRDGEQDRKRALSKGKLGLRDDVYFSETNRAWRGLETGYGDNPDNIGNLKDTPLKAITSPPYLDALNPPHDGDLEAKRLEIARQKGVSPDKVSHLDYTKKLKSITSPPYEESLPNGLGRKAAEQMVQAMYDKHGRTYSKEDFDYQVELILKRSNREYGDAEGQIGKLKDKPLKSIVSPPYSEAQSGGGIAKKGYTGSKHTPTDLVGNRSYMPEIHGQSEGQIANLKDTPLKSIVSPPYGETGVGDWKTGRAEFQAWVINEIKTKGYVEWQGKRYNEAEWRAMNHGRIDGRTTKGVHKHPTDGYSDNPDNIGGLPDKPLKAITSPPYEQSITGGKSGIEWQEEWGKPSESRQPSQDISYGESKENIGNLKDKPFKAITSPPYGETLSSDSDDGDARAKRLREAGHHGIADRIEKAHNWHEHEADYNPDNKENIGNLPDKPLKSIVSPPYANDARLNRAMTDASIGDDALAYGKTEGQIGRMPDKPLKSIVSPPYGDAEKRDRSKEVSNEKEKNYPRGDHNISAGYQGSDDNIGKLADKPLKSVMSPPHGLGKGTGHADKKRDTRPILKDRNVNLAYNDENPDNIGNLADKPLKSVTSPPYFDNKSDWDRRSRVANEGQSVTYSDEVGKRYRKNIGNIHYYDDGEPTSHKYAKPKEGDETYLEAMLKVYKEISLVSDVLCVVVKNPTRGGKLRRLDLDTIFILEASGWRIHCQHRALLFEELEQADMFVGSKKQVKGRLSFFKRLSWQNGNPVASWEDILICVRK